MEKRERIESLVSEPGVDLADDRHCVLCYSELQLVAMGKCGHKHMCNNCALRLRLIINDR